ncbi:MAG: hypothetical protein LBF22_02025 [Deltaproteobacteria bacterium]|jgi:hypothetical protein|nr:hypothetical protein [Deltaproteobacteria bacterium]
MISSILTLANNALLYSGKSTVNHAKYGFVPVEEVNPKSEEEKSVSTKPQSIEEVQGNSNVTKNFEESLKRHLKETGLTGPEAKERIAELTKEANQLVSEVRSEEGTLEANRLMASILTYTTGTDPESSLNAAVEAFYSEGNLVAQNETKKTLENLKPVEEVPTEEEILQKTEKSIEKNASEPASTEEEEETFSDGSVQNIFLSLKTSVDELKRLNPEAKNPSTSEYINLVQKVEADLAAQEGISQGFSEEELTSAFAPSQASYANAVSTAVSNPVSYPVYSTAPQDTLATAANNQARLAQNRLYNTLAYSSSYPKAGSLLSVTV